MTEAEGWIDADAAESRKLRDVFGRFLTGVTVVTMRDAAGRPRGFTANSFTTVSLDPPLVLVCVADKASSHDVLTGADRFGINILSDSQREVSTVFASGSADKFDRLGVKIRDGETPLLQDSLGCIECARESVVRAGDHSVVIGRVLRFRTSPGTPLGYYRGAYATFGMGMLASEGKSGTSVEIAAVLEHDGSVLLCRRPGCSNWTLPSLALSHGEDHRQLLPRLLDSLNLKATPSILYSIYQGAADAHMTMVFRCQITEPPVLAPLADGTELRMFAEGDAPWTLVAGKSPPNVLKRFFRERRDARLGIYWETESGGHLAPLGGEPGRWASDEHGIN